MTAKEKQRIGAKEYFNAILLIDKQIYTILEEIDRLNDLAAKCTSTLSVTPGGVGGNLEDTIARIVDYKQEVNADIDKLVDMKRERRGIIEQLPNKEHRLILTKRYICGHRWEKIAVDLGYNLRWVHRLHGRALSEAEKFLTGH